MLFLYFLILVICFLISIFVFLFFLAEVLAKFTTDAPFVPIPDGISKEIIKILDLNNQSVFYDLGCGDGRILVDIVKSNPNIKAVGVEKAFLPYFLAKIKTRKFENIEIKRSDIFKENLSGSTDIFLYLYPQVLDKLLPNLESQCKTGTRIISCDFKFKEKKPTKIIELNANSRRGKKLFVYII